MYLESVRGWLDARIGLTDLGKIARKKEIPIHRHSIWYYLGGMTLFLFSVQVVTGILLLLVLPAERRGGVRIGAIPHGRSAVRLAGALNSCLVGEPDDLRLVRAHAQRSAPQGVSAAARDHVAVRHGAARLWRLGLGFTGYLLPWNTLALFATKVGTEIPGAVPVVGDFIRLVLRGGEDVTGATLTRFYGIHVAFCPR